MICPYCSQDDIWRIIIKETNESFKACLECDTIWNMNEKISYGTGIGLKQFIHDRGWDSSKNKFEIMEKIHYKI